jgi:hypothetical protein
MNNRQDKNIFTSFRTTESTLVKLKLVLVTLFALFFYSAGMFTFLRGIPLVMWAGDAGLLDFLHLTAMVIPPLLLGFALFTLRSWAVYVLVAHVTLAVLSVIPLWYYKLEFLIRGTLLNNLLILFVLLVVMSLSSELYKTRYGILLTVLYVVLLVATSGIQIYTRLQF